MVRKLFEPFKIGNLQLPNRIAMPAMVTQYGDSSGKVTQRQIDYYIERAKNRVGLIIVEATCVYKGAKIAQNELCVYDDTFVPGLTRLADSIKKAGACCFLQIVHGGRRAHAKDNGGVQPTSASGISTYGGEVPRELSAAEIEDIIEAFAKAAVRAKEAHFDGVELHFAHGYLVAEFLSPLSNKRTDRYGGDLASRARLPREILRRVRQKVGADYIVSSRICGNEHIRGGFSQREGQRLAMMLEEDGLDSIHVSAGYVPSGEEGYFNCTPSSPPPMFTPHGCYLYLSEGIKKVVKIPVFAVGRLDDPELAEAAVNEGKTDMVSLGRALIADPAFADKVYRGQSDAIRNCIACDHCINNLMADTNLRCAVNPEVGREAASRISRALAKKRVLVIGGGPGGMEVARVAALRGHQVTLVEKKSCLGGNLIAASAMSFKKDIGLFNRYLTNAIKGLGVDIRLGSEADLKMVLELKPDVVVVATGSSPVVPAIPGVKGKNVTDAVKVLEGSVKTGNNVVMGGGGAVGCETAVFLAQSGKKVTIVEMRNTDFSATDGLAPDMNAIIRRWFLSELLPSLPIDVIGKSTFREVTGEGLIVEDNEGQRQLIAGDTIVFAPGMKSNTALAEKLRGKVSQIYEVGDCVKPCHIIEAVEEAARVGRLI